MAKLTSASDPPTVSSNAYVSVSLLTVADEETLSTLRYADAAKKIRTHAVVNEDPNAKLIRDLKEELECESVAITQNIANAGAVLRSRVAMGGDSNGESTWDPSIPAERQIVTYQTKDGEIRRVTKLELQDQLQASEKLMENLNLTWEQKMAQTQAIHVERERALEELGISVDKEIGVLGVRAPQKHPSLVNLNEDPVDVGMLDIPDQTGNDHRWEPRRQQGPDQIVRRASLTGTLHVRE